VPSSSSGHRIQGRMRWCGCSPGQHRDGGTWWYGRSCRGSFERPDVDPRVAIVIRDMTAMPAASPRQNQIGRIDTGALPTTAPAMLRYGQFRVGCRMAPGQACQCREKQQRSGLSPTAVIRLRCLAKYEANARPQYEARAGGVTSTSSSSSPSSWPWLTSFSPDDIGVG